jgi:hypothetical protein
MPVSVEKLLNESNRMGELPFMMLRDEFELPTDWSDSGLAAIPPADMPDEELRCGNRVLVGADSLTALSGSS